MILKKVSVPVGVEGRMYCDSMLLSMTNGKFCSLRSNFKQEIFEQFQDKIWFQCSILQKHTAANVCTHVFELNVLDDKKNSWCAPGDCTGKVFVKIRDLNRNHQDTSNLSYADAEHFLRFIDKYVSRAVGNNTYARWKKFHLTKTLLDIISASDIAYTMLVYENSKDVWEEELITTNRPVM